MARRFPRETKYALALGETSVRLGDRAAARAVLEPLTTNGAASVRGAAHYRLARSWMEAKDAAQALKHLDAARAADAESVATASAQRFRGEVLERLGQNKEAALAYRRARTCHTTTSQRNRQHRIPPSWEPREAAPSALPK